VPAYSESYTQIWLHVHERATVCYSQCWKSPARVWAGKMPSSSWKRCTRISGHSHSKTRYCNPHPLPFLLHYTRTHTHTHTHTLGLDCFPKAPPRTKSFSDKSSPRGITGWTILSLSFSRSLSNNHPSTVTHTTHTHAHTQHTHSTHSTQHTSPTHKRTQALFFSLSLLL
jgi:hypothetical protein